LVRGKVYLVGAGPGDPELLTLKAKRLLFEADVVLFDRLLDPGMMDGIKAELIDVGKSAGAHKLTQEEINQLLIEKAEAGNVVVRLREEILISLAGAERRPWRCWRGAFRWRWCPESPRPSLPRSWREFRSLTGASPPP